jgi:hypothetical protein
VLANFQKLQDLHACRLLEISPNLIQWQHGEVLRASLPCANYQPLLNQTTFEICDVLPRRWSDFSILAQSMTDCAKAALQQTRYATTYEVSLLTAIWQKLTSPRSFFSL